MKALENPVSLRVLIFLTMLNGGVLLLANIVAVKLWDFSGVAVDGGIVIFPLIYVLGDLLVELYGRKMADFVVWVSGAINLMGAGVFLVVGWLPAYPGWGEQSAYEAILGFVPRVVAGSLLAYVVSGLANNLIFEKIKQRSGRKKLWYRVLGSSAVAKLLDVAIFEAVAFFGVLSWGEFLWQAGFAYVAGMILECLLVPVTYVVVRRIR